MAINFCIFSGRLVKDPEIRYTTKDKKAVATFTLAVDNYHGDKTADFHKCIAFGKTAELIDQYCIKGSGLLVVGELHDNNWEDKDGKKHYDKQVVVREIQFMDGKTKVANARDIEPGGEFTELDDDSPLPF